MNDTDRLNFILKYMCIDDVGDEEYVPGINVDYESLCEELQKYNPIKFNDNIRDVIDRAILRDQKKIKNNIGNK